MDDEKTLKVGEEKLVLPKEYRLTPFDKKPNVLDVSLAIRHLALMLRSGLALGDAISVLCEQSEGGGMEKVFKFIDKRVHAGTGLAGAMAYYPKVFSGIVVSIIDVGEQAGTLEENLLFIADYLKADYELKKKVRGALIYPMIVFILTVAELLGVMFYVLPKLESFFTSFENIPQLTVAIMSASKFIRGNIWLMLGATIAFITSLKMFFGSTTGKNLWQRVSLRLPVVKDLVRGDVLARFSRTLGVLLKSGIPISKALKIASTTTDNIEYEKVLESARQKLKGGVPLTTIFKAQKKYFPPTYVKMIEAGEGTGTLEENLMYLYDYYSNEVKDMASNLTTLLEPVLLVVVGVMIGVLAIIIIAPIYQLTGSITN